MLQKITPGGFHDPLEKAPLGSSGALWGRKQGVMAQNPPGIIAQLAINCRSSKGEVLTHD
jgi:hypothetical protein